MSAVQVAPSPCIQEGPMPRRVSVTPGLCSAHTWPWSHPMLPARSPLPCRLACICPYLPHPSTGGLPLLRRILSLGVPVHILCTLVEGEHQRSFQSLHPPQCLSVVWVSASHSEFPAQLSLPAGGTCAQLMWQEVCGVCICYLPLSHVSSIWYVVMLSIYTEVDS